MKVFDGATLVYWIFFDYVDTKLIQQVSGACLGHLVTVLNRL